MCKIHSSKIGRFSCQLFQPVKINFKKGINCKPNLFSLSNASVKTFTRIPHFIEFVPELSVQPDQFQVEDVLTGEAKRISFP